MTIQNILQTIYNKCNKGLGLDQSEKEILRFIILFRLYEISKGYTDLHISLDSLYSILNASDENIKRITDKSIEYLKNDWLVESKSFCTVSISHIGIKEIEAAVVNPKNNTIYFPANIAIILNINEKQIKEIFETINYRYLFLKKSYELYNEGKEITNPYEIGHYLNIDNSLLKRIYFYLGDEGLIKFFSNGGKFTLTPQGIKTIENKSISYAIPHENEIYNQFLTLEKIVKTFYDFNVLCESKLGFEIFKSNAKYILDLSKNYILLNTNSKDENAFISILLLLGTLIDEIDNDKIKQITSDENGSINILKKIFNSKGIIAEEPFNTLRKIHKLRSTYSPIHSGMSDAINLLNYFNIRYPIIDYKETTEIILDNFLKSLEDLKRLYNYKTFVFIRAMYYHYISIYI